MFPCNEHIERRRYWPIPFSYTPWMGTWTPVSTEVREGEQTGETV